MEEVLGQAAKSSDFRKMTPLADEELITLYYFSSLVDGSKASEWLLQPLQEHRCAVDDAIALRACLPFQNVTFTHDPQVVETALLAGCILILLQHKDQPCLLVDVHHDSLGLRQNNETENEFSVVGPKKGFVESVDVNVHLLRTQMQVPELVVEELTIGSVSKTRVVVVYLQGVTNEELVGTIRQRLEDIDFDVLFDSSQLDQIISDHSNTPFPLFLSTERIDRVTYAIISGQVAVLANGSPYAVTGPSNFLDFFISPEDYYLPWILGSFFRLIRLTCVILSIFATPLYVAVLTFHFEVIPDNILVPLIESRMHVPFPPIIEVIFLEITIELLREAGARLPTKIGQTLGIVGGIVIGEASVRAALTSNILLIIVALAALASFTTPIFKMANTIRLIRFPFIFLAGLWGGLGIVAGFVLLMGHLLRLKSLGMPYLVPLFPFRGGNFTDSVIRASYLYTTTRSIFLRPQKLKRYSPAARREKPDED
ncbi:spore germination protein [Paenibacillus sp. PAMC21692]|uniref:spore germination protein n=1 Tax=Paenibacillus sp. PAMC21692 TaxID=2762320 RepID=UPI00164EAAD5|nr:spore germination protein [Paenibacillus sp. PAMC21692]